MPTAYVTQTSRGLIVGSQDDLVEVFWCSEGLRAKLFGKVLNGRGLSLLGESRRAARHGRSWRPKKGHVGVYRRFWRLVVNREVLDVLLGVPARFVRANVMSAG